MYPLRKLLVDIVVRLGGAATAGFAAGAAADPSVMDATLTGVHESFAVHGEFTYVEQRDSDFNAPYAGQNSLTPNQAKQTTDASLWLGAALGSAAEIWIDPEVDQGFGLNDTLGVAGFPSGEAYKVGSHKPYFRMQRFFVRTTVNAEGEGEHLDASAGFLGRDQSANRWVFTIGKISVTDVFDNNAYAHDPREDFLNWTAIDGGSFDYAADAWGYTVGAAAEWYRGPWTSRVGAFDLSDVPNSARLDLGFHQFQMIAEVEHRHEIAGRGGKVLITGFESRARMALLDEAVELAESSGTAPDVSAVRRYRSRLGGVVGLEQELTSSLGAFARYSKAAGNVEAYEFSDIDQSIAIGLSLKGAAWRRGGDTVGLASINNTISAARQRYLNAGGLGILVGDGKLPHPGPEQIIETYYSAALGSYVRLSLDYQWIGNPAYNRDRGPASVFAVRVHTQF